MELGSQMANTSTQKHRTRNAIKPNGAEERFQIQGSSRRGIFSGAHLDPPPSVAADVRRRMPVRLASSGIRLVPSAATPRAVRSCRRKEADVCVLREKWILEPCPDGGLHPGEMGAGGSSIPEFNDAPIAITLCKV